MPDPPAEQPGPPSLTSRVTRAVRRAAQFYEEVGASRWRQESAKEARAQHDTLRALVLLDTLGVDNPVAFETLDAVPYLLADAHDWHLRLGRKDFGMPGGCC